MLCEICGHRPGVRKIVTVGKTKRTVCICPECEARASAEQAGRAAKEGRGQAASAGLECKTCGWTAEDFLATNSVGCERCYTDLSPVLEEAVRRCQPNGLHVGKAPDRAYAVRGGEYDHLRKELDRAVKEERYSDAAALKRLLDRLKEGK